MNEYDSNRILDLTKKINYFLTKNLAEADCYVLNTCHIREKATDKVYHEVGRVKKQFRNKKKPIVLIVGCVAQAEGDLLIKKEKYIDAVIGPQSYYEINKIILEIDNKKIKIRSLEVEHGKVKSNCFIIDEKLAYITDVSNIYEKDFKYFKNLKFLIIDCLWYDYHPSHFNLEKSLNFIKKFQPKYATLSNLSPVLDYNDLKKRLPKNVSPAVDGMTFRL